MDYRSGMQVIRSLAACFLEEEAEKSMEKCPRGQWRCRFPGNVTNVSEQRKEGNRHHNHRK